MKKLQLCPSTFSKVPVDSSLEEHLRLSDFRQGEKKNPPTSILFSYYLLPEQPCSCKLLQCTSYFRISIQTSKPWAYMTICLFILHMGKMQHTAFLYTNTYNTFSFDCSVSFEYVNFTLLVKSAFGYRGWFIQAFIETLLPPNSVSNTNTIYQLLQNDQIQWLFELDKIKTLNLLNGTNI